MARRRIGHATAVRMAETLLSGREMELVHVSRDQEQRALDLLRRHGDKRYSFTDATSFVVMRDRESMEAFTFDADFTRAGFVTLPGPR